MDEKEKQLYQAKAEVFKALGHPTRLWITEQLAEGERCVRDFVELAQVDFSTISKHLSVLKQAGIVQDEKRGKQVYYSLKVPCVHNFMQCVDAVLRDRLAGQIKMFG
ncbi:MAG: metalloregulator ArsR/SmtB family transcription factor [Desulfobulbaceae bacterium]|nr:metalloregulator ArsR/SmtB family transcription factor [Desulfobulbaceae bacterium]